MQIYKCDRCGKILEPKDRYCGHISGIIADLCKTCWEEFSAERDSVERLHEKQLQHLQVKYGMLSLKETIERRIQG